MKNRNSLIGPRLLLSVIGAAAALSLTACDKTVESSKSSSVKKTETPEGTKTTTETTEKTVEKERKDNPK